MLKTRIHLNEPSLDPPSNSKLKYELRIGSLPANLSVDDLARIGTAATNPRPKPSVTTEVGTITLNPIYSSRVANGFKSLIIPDILARKQQKQFVSLMNQVYPGEVILPGLASIGCGYDIFGPYALPSSLKRMLFDVNKMGPLSSIKINNKTYKHWPIVEVFPLSSSLSKVSSGSTYVEYCKSLSVKAGLDANFLGFHAHADMEYSTSETTNWYSAFSNVFDVTTLWKIHIKDVGNLRDYLLDEVKDAIDTWDPDRLFDEFGLFFTTGLEFGGRLNYTSLINMYGLHASMNLDVYSEASYLNAIGINNSVNVTSGFTTYNENSESNIQTWGGDPLKGGGSIVDQASYQAWKDSISKNPIMTNFTLPTTKRPLTPLWTLASDPARQQLIRERMEPYEENISQRFRSENALNPATKRHGDFLITTYTGKRDAAGTDSGIWVNLHGVDRLGQLTQSGFLKHDDDRDNHNKGRADDILFTLPDLGRLTQIDIYHDGKTPSDRGPWWYLDSVEVMCLHNSMKYTAPCNAGFNKETKTFELYL